MPTIRVETVINAPIDRCFDLARDIDVHMQTTKRSGERAVAGVTSGMMSLGDTVTFEARHLGFRHRLTSKIVVFERPNLFVDEMVSGPFKRMRHEHRFEVSEIPPPLLSGRGGGKGEGFAEDTLMVDFLDFQSPFGPIGLLVDKLFLGSYMRRFLEERGAALNDIAQKAGGSCEG
jgi:hypothetical protein